MYAIGIDIGTTSICGILLEAGSGRVVRSYTKDSNAFIKTPNTWEKIQDADRLVSLAREILDDLIERGEGKTAVIGVTGQMHGIVYCDAEGKAVSPLYTWQDARGNEPYGNTTFAEYLHSYAGYGNVTDFYNREKRLRPADTVCYCTIQDYFVMSVCGRKEPLLHISNAASFGCFDLISQTFSYEYSAEITDEYTLAGNYRGIPVSIAIGDNQASVFSTLTDEEKLLLNVGTGSQVSVISDKMAEGKDIECRPYFEHKYLIVGAALCGGRAYMILKNFFAAVLASAQKEAAANVYEWMEDLLKGRTEGQTSRLRVDTRFAGTRSEPSLRGSITGIGGDNFTPAELTYSVLEGMILELHELYTRMGVTRRGIVGSGNGIRRNETLIRLAEEHFRGRLYLPVHLEEAAFGAALYGLLASGIYEKASDVQRLVKFETEGGTLD